MRTSNSVDPSYKDAIKKYALERVAYYCSCIIPTVRLKDSVTLKLEIDDHMQQLVFMLHKDVFKHTTKVRSTKHNEERQETETVGMLPSTCWDAIKDWVVKRLPFKTNFAINYTPITTVNKIYTEVHNHYEERMCPHMDELSSHKSHVVWVAGL